MPTPLLTSYLAEADVPKDVRPTTTSDDLRTSAGARLELSRVRIRDKAAAMR